MSKCYLGDEKIMNAKELREGPLCGKKIVLLAEYYSSGGTRTYLKQLIDFYAETGADLVLIGLMSSPDRQVTGWLEPYGFEYTCYWRVLGKDVTSTSDLRPGIWSPYFISRERSRFRRFLQNEGADCIVVSAGTPGQFAGAAGAMARGIYILHTYPHGRRQQYFGRWIMHSAFKRVGQLVAVSDFQKRKMARLWRLGKRASSVVVIRNTVGDPIVRNAQSDRAPLMVMTASWVEAYKEPLEWIEVAREVGREIGSEQVRFVWFGEGKMLTPCRQAVEDVPKGVQVEFAGHQDELGEAYARADVYLQMSSIENMSLSVIEALRYGIPAVCTDVGGIPEIQVDGETGFLVPVHDPGAAARAVVSLLVDGQTRDSMGSAASKRYEMAFSQAKWIAEMLRLHADMLVSHRSHQNGLDGRFNPMN